LALLIIRDKLINLRDGDAATRKKETDSGRQRRGKKCRICGVEEGCIERIMSYTRIRIEIGKILDERGKGEVVKWMKEIKRLREVHRTGIERVRECERG